MDLPAPRPDGAESSASSAERLLAALYTACSHDLPNQILAMQSLIHLISMDEANLLDAAGREYLTRLRTVSERIAGIAEYQKALVRLSRATPAPRRIALDEMFRELQIESRTVLQTPLTWDLRIAPGGVWADYDLVYPSIGDLVRALVERAAPAAATAIVTSSRLAEVTVVELVVRGAGFEKTAAVFERRGDVLLARERLHAAGVGLKIGPARSDEASVFLEFDAVMGEPEKP